MRRSVTLFTFLALISGGAPSATLQDVVTAAWAADNEWQAARLNWQAAREIERQGLGGLLPAITAEYNHLRNKQHYESSAGQSPFTAEYDSQAAAVNVIQPLFRVDSWYDYRQAQALTSAAQADFQAERQAFLLRAAEQYMTVLRTREELTSAEAEEKAIGRQLEQTRERYNVGLVPITDVHEAQAAYDLSRVGLIIAVSNFQIARDELEALTGKRWESLAGLQPELPMTGPEPENAAVWVELARQQNPQVVAARYQSESARAASRSTLGEQLPQVNLVGQYQHSHVLDEEAADPASPLFGRLNDTENRYYGIQVTMPIFVGGVLNSQRKQAALNYQAAEEQYRLAWRDVGQETLSLHRLVETDVLRVKARRQALLSAESALQATESGYQVGTRNVVDVLNAQRTLYAAQRDWFGARYDYILDTLRLKAAAGTLTEEDLTEVNTWLSSELSVDLYPYEAEGQNPATSPSVR